MVKILKGSSDKSHYDFTNAFMIGRDETCDIRFSDDMVSRIHAEVTLEDRIWSYHDLNSTNGSYRDGQKIGRQQISENILIELGFNGPIIEVIPGISAIEDVHSPSVTHYVEHYFDDTRDETGFGLHTKMIRAAFGRVYKKKKSRYYQIIGAALILSILIGIYAVYQNFKVQKQKALAEDIFYNMKILELQLNRLEAVINKTGNSGPAAQIKDNYAAMADMKKKYDAYIKELAIYDGKNETEQLILKMARLFGECEINVPKNFIEEVKKYIKYWQSTKRISIAVKRSIKYGYSKIIAEKMLSRHLPPQFFYLALQESDFKYRTVGPLTRYGYAKGIWQFIPPTAFQYGLKTGPLVELNKYDPRDERFNFEKATEAASLYLADIYNTEAQASGLLVIASYNWGVHNIRHLIAQLPENPRERNFWNLLNKYNKKIPRETYQYVLYIFSASVIGENPQLFGFNFKQPLKQVIDEVTGY